jgi:protocatechuate 3,4-dioxygenase beta subunit
MQHVHEREKTLEELEHDMLASFGLADFQQIARDQPTPQTPKGWKERTIDLRVMVTDYRGRPVKGATVNALKLGELMSRSGETDEKGVAHVEVGGKAELQFTQPDYATTEQQFDMKWECEMPPSSECTVLGLLNPKNWTNQRKSPTTTTTTTTSTTTITQTTTTTTTTTTTSTVQYVNEREQTLEELEHDMLASFGLADFQQNGRDSATRQTPKGWKERTIDLRVMVTDYRGRPVKGAIVNALKLGELMYRSGETDETGVAHVEVGGKAELQFTHPDFATSEQQFDMKRECEMPPSSECTVLGLLNPKNWTHHR